MLTACRLYEPGRPYSKKLLSQELVRLSAEKGNRPFFFGARQWVVDKVVAAFEKKYPNLNVAGYRNGYYNSHARVGHNEG